jgi:hypothetical protein
LVPFRRKDRHSDGAAAGNFTKLAMTRRLRLAEPHRRLEPGRIERVLGELLDGLAAPRR